MFKYARPTSIDSPAVGNLYQARALKKRAWERVQALRRTLRQPGLHKTAIGVLLLKAESNHAEAMRMEQGALIEIERRANELGLTTKKDKAHDVARS